MDKLHNQKLGFLLNLYLYRIHFHLFKLVNNIQRIETILRIINHKIKILTKKKIYKNDDRRKINIYTAHKPCKHGRIIPSNGNAETVEDEKFVE